MAGYDFNTESLRLRVMKAALAAEDVDPALLAALEEADVTADAIGIAPSARGAAKLPPEIRARLESPERPAPLRRGASPRSDARARADERFARELGAQWVDSGAALVEQLALDLSAVGTQSLQRSIPAPLRITHINVNGQSGQAGAGDVRYAWSVTPPGIGESAGASAANAALSPIFQGSPLSLPCDVPVTTGAVEMRASATNFGATERIQILILVTYRRLIRRSAPALPPYTSVGVLPG